MEYGFGEHRSSINTIFNRTSTLKHAFASFRAFVNEKVNRISTIGWLKDSEGRNLLTILGQQLKVKTNE